MISSTEGEEIGQCFGLLGMKDMELGLWNTHGHHERIEDMLCRYLEESICPLEVFS